MQNKYIKDVRGMNESLHEIASSLVPEDDNREPVPFIFLNEEVFRGDNGHIIIEFYNLYREVDK